MGNRYIALTRVLLGKEAVNQLAIATIIVLMSGCSSLPSNVLDRLQSGQAPSGAPLSGFSLIDEKGLTTNLADTYPEARYLNRAPLPEARSVETLPRDQNGYFVMKPGHYTRPVNTY